MLTLAERHAERAKRIAENRAEFAGGTAVTAAAAIVAARAAADLIAGLGDDARAEFDEAMRDYDPVASRSSLAEDDRGNTMAGIGVVNTKVVPASAEGGNGGGTAPGWETIPETPDLQGSNINGAALDAQGAGGAGAGGSWGGDTTAAATPPAPAKRTNKTEGE